MLGVVVLAVIGFLVFGGGDDDDEATPDTTTTTEDTTTTTEDTTTTTEDTTTTTSGSGIFEGDELVVFNAVPFEFDDSCVSSEPVGLQLATLECFPDTGPETVFYSTYDTVSDLEIGYDSALEGAGLTRDLGAGCASVTPAEGPYTLGDNSGRLACYDDADGATRIIWTSDESIIQVEAVQDDGDDVALYGWWADDLGGPL